MTSRTLQTTLKSPAELKGPGLHTGKVCSVTLNPAEPDTGILFETEQGKIPASVENLCGTNRGTCLRGGTAEVHTVEHVLAALAGLGVDNARVEVSGPEIPAADGSALPYVELIDRVGIREQSAPSPIRRLEAPVWVTGGDKYLLATPADEYAVRALIAFEHPLIGEQAVSLRIDPETFRREIAPARTFCTSGEINSLLALGLGLGGSEENVIVVYDDRYSVPLRYKDEFVRHKVLDLIGDLALIGARLHADVTAVKPSHALNASLAALIVGKGGQGTQGG